MQLSSVINGAVGAFENHCAGYLNPGASGLGYIAAVKMSVGKVKNNGNDGLETIVSYDGAEKNDAYMGQINRMNASAFCGLNGALWGYDLASADEFKNGAIKPIKIERRWDGARVPVWDVKPLLDATERLFGTDEQRRFPPLPGALVPCAEKNCIGKGPGAIWSMIAIAMVEDRENASNLFIQLTGFRNEAAASFDQIDLNRMSTAILRRSEDQQVLCKEIFMGYKELTVSGDEVGCAICCMPYITLAQRAIPDGCKPADLIHMSISQWENALRLPPFKKKK